MQAIRRYGSGLFSIDLENFGWLHFIPQWARNFLFLSDATWYDHSTGTKKMFIWVNIVEIFGHFIFEMNKDMIRPYDFPLFQ